MDLCIGKWSARKMCCVKMIWGGDIEENDTRAIKQKRQIVVRICCRILPLKLGVSLNAKNNDSVRDFSRR